MHRIDTSYAQSMDISVGILFLEGHFHMINLDGQLLWQWFRVPLVQWWRLEGWVVSNQHLHPLVQGVSEGRLQLILGSVVDVAVKATSSLNGPLCGKCSLLLRRRRRRRRRRKKRRMKRIRRRRRVKYNDSKHIH